ncbi:hypothetical protein THRCLA_02138 [Thraustotheca clavata]|uniref:Secreted protein n=1 Tax=Thraustotheca clavata TaxID=74557 RepID=A0A1W0A6H3_9STRA|nr:hypothetical protein THRCLA_02138 [Thraustotheca clavata]
MLSKICFGLLLILSVVSGHGLVTNPAAEFDPTKMPTSFISKIFPWGNSMVLRDMLQSNTTSPCGYSLTNVAKKPIPAHSTMTWQNPDSGDGLDLLLLTQYSSL